TAPASAGVSPRSLHDALPIYQRGKQDRAEEQAEGRRAAVAEDVEQLLAGHGQDRVQGLHACRPSSEPISRTKASSRLSWPLRSRSEEHTSELQSRENLVCRLL